MKTPSSETVLAPPWHTALLVALIVSVAFVGLVLMPEGVPSPAPAARVWTLHLPVILVQAGMLFYVCRVGRTANAFGALLGRRWDGVSRLLGDLGLATACFAAVHAIEFGWYHWIDPHGGASIATLLPRSSHERLTWAVLSLSVGVGEEFVYRGYLQTQLGAFTRSPAVGILLQASLFGLAHGDQGPGAMVRLAFYGVVFGVVAKRRGSLLPAIVAHVAIDLSSGLRGG